MEEFTGEEKKKFRATFAAMGDDREAIEKMLGLCSEHGGVLTDDQLAEKIEISPLEVGRLMSICVGLGLIDPY